MSVFVHSSLQFTPAIRPCLQTIAIGLVAFGENYKRHQSGIGQHHLFCSCTLSSSSHLILIHTLYSSPRLFYIAPWPLTVYLLMLCVWIVDALSSLGISRASWCASSIFQNVLNMHTVMYRGRHRRTCTIIHTFSPCTHMCRHVNM